MPEIIIPSLHTLPRGYLSYSQVSKYLRCGYQYALSYVVPSQERDSNKELVIGSVGHDAIHETHQFSLADGELMKEFELADYAVRYADRKLAEVAEKEPWSPKAKEELPQARDMMADCMRVWWEHFGRECEVVSTERKFEGYIGCTRCIAYVDLIRNVKLPTGKKMPQVVDYKITGKAKPKTWVNDNLQLAMYAILTGIPDVAIAFIERPNASRGATFKLIETHVTEEQQKHARHIVGDVATGILKGSFPRREPGSWECTPKYCSEYNRCRGDALL